MTSIWLDRAHANREMARELRRAAPERTLEVSRLTMIRSAQALEQEAWLLEALAFEERERDTGSLMPMDGSAVIH